MSFLTRLITRTKSDELFETTDAVFMIKNAIYKKFEDNRELYSFKDIESVKSDPTFAQRFINCESNRNQLTADQLETAIQMLDNYLIWRKIHNLANLDYGQLPIEFFNSWTLFALGKDRSGNPIFYVRLKNHFKGSDFHPLIMQSLFFEAEHIISTLKCDMQFTIIVDAGNASITKFDYTFLGSFLAAMEFYLPMVNKLYMVDASWLMRPLITSVVKLFPKSLRDLVKITNRDELFNVFGHDHLLTFLGGKQSADCSHRTGLSNLQIVGKQRGISEDRIQQLTDHIALCNREG